MIKLLILLPIIYIVLLYLTRKSTIIIIFKDNSSNELHDVREVDVRSSVIIVTTNYKIFSFNKSEIRLVIKTGKGGSVVYYQSETTAEKRAA